MKRWFFTFGQGHPYAFQYVEIEADTLEEAREAMIITHGNKWAFCYDETTFAPQPAKYGLTRLATLRKNEWGTYRSTEPNHV